MELKVERRPNRAFLVAGSKMSQCPEAQGLMGQLKLSTLINAEENRGFAGERSGGMSLSFAEILRTTKTCVFSVDNREL